MERELSKAPVARDNKQRDAGISLRQAALLTPAQRIFQLHRTIGNRAVGRLLQAKLEVSYPGDLHEQEAERFAGVLTSMATPGTPQVARQPADPVSPSTEAPNGIHAHAEEAVSTASTSTGQPLPSNLRRKFEEGLGADLSAVRIHTGPASARASEAISARAYAVGPDIHFNHGQYRPETSEGQHLLAHEVVHTVQQGFGAASAQAKLDVSQPGDSLELEADRAADTMAKDQALLVSQASTTSPIALKQQPASPFAGAADAEAIEAAQEEDGVAPVTISEDYSKEQAERKAERMDTFRRADISFVSPHNQEHYAYKKLNALPGDPSTPVHAGALATTAPAIARQPKNTGTDVKPKPTPSPTGIPWEDALATMNAIRRILPNVGPHGIVLPTIDLSPANMEAMDAAIAAQSTSLSSAPGTPFPESLLANVPERYHELVREWHYIVHPVHVEPRGIVISIYGTMRETHLNMAVAQTQRLVNELATEGDKDSTLPYLSDYWNSVAHLRDEIGQEVVAEAAQQAKTVVEGLSFEGKSENEHARTAIDKATEATHIAIKVATQFLEHSIEHAAEHAAHEAKRLRTLENLLADAGQEGAWPAYSEGMLKSAARMDVVSGLTYLEGGLHGLAGILAIADPAKREEMLRKRSDIVGGIAAGTQIEKVVLQLAAGATAVVGATTYAIARLLGKEVLAAEVLSKGIKVAEKFELVISAAMVVHGVLTLLDSEASAEEKEEAALETAIGATPLIAKATGAFEGGPATLAVVVGFFTIKWLGEAAYGFSVDLARIDLSMCYEFMKREATTVNDNGLRLALALKFWQIEGDQERKAMFWGVIPTLRSKLHESLSDALQHATIEAGARDRDPAAHEPLRRRFEPLAKKPIDRDEDLLEVAQEYVQTVAEALAHQKEVLEEDVEDMWEKHG